MILDELEESRSREDDFSSRRSFSIDEGNGKDNATN